VLGDCRLGKRPVEHTEGLEALGAVAALCDGIVRVVQLDHLQHASWQLTAGTRQLQPGVPVGPPKGVLAFTSSRGSVERIFNESAGESSQHYSGRKQYGEDELFRGASGGPTAHQGGAGEAGSSSLECERGGARGSQAEGPI